MEDDKILDLLFERSESALDEVTHKYSRLYKGILRKVLEDEGDIEECANDVLLAIWNSIPPNRPGSLSAYVCKIARRIGIDRLRYHKRKRRNTDYLVMLSELEESLSEEDAPQAADGPLDGRIREVLEEFIRDLDGETQILFLRRYVYLESVASLAGRFDLSENYISVKLYRARKKLKHALEKEGIRI